MGSEENASAKGTFHYPSDFHVVLKRDVKVIAEVIGGIILGSILFLSQVISRWC